MIKVFLKEDIYLAGGLTLMAFLLRLPFVSSWLEDWDSVQFVLGMHDFSITNHQPHPPGYPLYILMGKFFWMIFGNETQALGFLSCLFGSLAMIPLYLLAKRMFDKNVAVLAGLLFILVPVEWIVSEIPISNIPGLFFLLVFGYLAYIFVDKPNELLLVAGFSGLILGIRFTDLPVIIGLWGLIITRRIIVKHDFKYPFLLVLTFLIGLSLWLIPTILVTGFHLFIKESSDTARYVMWHDVKLGKSLPPVELLLVRAGYVWNLLKIGYTPYFLVLCAVAVLLLIKQRKIWPQFRYQFLLMWLFSYGIVLIFYYNLELAQYVLPLIVPLVIFTALIFTFFWRRKGYQLITLMFFILMVMILIRSSWSQLNQLKIVPPTIAPVLYVKENFNPPDTTLITTFLYRQFQYYAPEFKNYYGITRTPQDIQTKFVIIDSQGLKDKIPALDKYQLIDTRVYSQQNRLFARLNETKVYVLKCGQ